MKVVTLRLLVAWCVSQGPCPVASLFVIFFFYFVATGGDDVLYKRKFYFRCVVCFYFANVISCLMFLLIVKFIVVPTGSVRRSVIIFVFAVDIVRLIFYRPVLDLIDCCLHARGYFKILFLVENQSYMVVISHITQW